MRHSAIAMAAVMDGSPTVSSPDPEAPSASQISAAMRAVAPSSFMDQPTMGTSRPPGRRSHSSPSRQSANRSDAASERHRVMGRPGCGIRAAR